MTARAAAARHPLRIALIGDHVPEAEPEQTVADSVRQFLLGWLGGLVFFGTLFA